jgi:hypothetical protein
MQKINNLCNLQIYSMQQFFFEKLKKMEKSFAWGEPFLELYAICDEEKNMI